MKLAVTINMSKEEKKDPLKRTISNKEQKFRLAAFAASFSNWMSRKILLEERKTEI